LALWREIADICARCWVIEARIAAGGIAVGYSLGLTFRVESGSIGTFNLIQEMGKRSRKTPTEIRMS
jgi:hypothetical protein